MRWVWAAVLTAAAGCAETPRKPAAQNRAPASDGPANTRPVANPSSCFQRQPPAMPLVPPSDVDVKDALSKAQISSVVREHVVPIDNCYSEQLQHQPGLQGGLVVGWRIEPAGNVSRSWIVEDTLGSKPAECIAEEICSWQFPAAKLPTSIARFPFLFKIGQSPPSVPAR
jgi:hypothetical protein